MPDEQQLQEMDRARAQDEGCAQEIATQSRHPGVSAMMKFFEFSHLPERLQAVSKPFGELAEFIANGPQNAETTVALRKLLEAKDCAVRARL